MRRLFYAGKLAEEIRITGGDAHHPRPHPLDEERTMNILLSLLSRLRCRARLGYHVAADGSVTIRQGWRRVRLSHSNYLLLAQLKGWQQ